MIRMQIEGVGLDQLLQTVVVLRDLEGGRILPIWIGPAEAQSIAWALEGKEPPRPFAHDLLRNILAQLNASVLRIVIHDLQENTFYALISLKTPKGVKELDCRPSDALAMASRFNSPIFVAGKAMQALIREDSQDNGEIERFKNLVEDVDLGPLEPA